MSEVNKVIAGNCITVMNSGEIPKVDLVFADPPFNIGYKYDVYEDRKAYDDYKKWTIEWMTACRDVLADKGSFWIAIGDDYAAEVRMIGRDLGLHLRNWVIWHYTFGQNTKSKFARSHTHLFYFVKDPTDFTFNDEAVRTFSDRQRVYNDKRANPNGRIPDDVWTEFPRVCGTFGEREGWHPCQMPETILARIVRVCSNPDDLVFDPFSGSGTTLVVAKKLNRNYLGTELSKKYVREIERRLEGTEPLADVSGERTGKWPESHLEELRSVYREAQVPTDKLIKNQDLLYGLVQQLHRRLEASGSDIVDAYQPDEVWRQLEKLRKQGKLGKIKVHASEPQGPKIRDIPTLLDT
jgi:site-specific DNA-methyltransferase (adenine-specific)